MITEKKYKCDGCGDEQLQVWPDAGCLPKGWSMRVTASGDTHRCRTCKTKEEK